MADNFDALLVESVSIYSASDSSDSPSGQLQDYTFVETVAGRLSTLAPGRESRSEKQAVVTAKRVYMRDYQSLTEHHQLEISGVRYDITSVLRLKNADGTVHHLEASVDETDA